MKNQEGADRNPGKPQETTNKPWLEQLGIPVTKKKFWSSDKFLSLLAFLISLGTFSTFAYQTYLIQKQQYANTMPYLMVSTSRSYNEKYYDYDLGIINKGVGPAFVQEVRVYYEDSVYEQDPANFYFNYVDRADLPDSIDYAVNNGYIIEGTVISAGEYMPLLESLNKYSASVIGLFREEAILEITYSSIYDEVWRVSSDNPVPEKIE